MKSFNCNECGGVMVYRSTNNITRESKWKCKECGHIMVNGWVPTPLEKIRRPEPKYYTLSGGAYQVKKRIDGHQFYLGSFKSEKMAKKFVALMKVCDWDLERVAEFREVCSV